MFVYIYWLRGSSHAQANIYRLNLGLGINKWEISEKRCNSLKLREECMETFSSKTSEKNLSMNKYNFQL